MILREYAYRLLTVVAFNPYVSFQLLLFLLLLVGNVDQAVSYWSKAVRNTAAGGPSMDVLQSVIEKSVVLGMATNSGSASANLADLITTYAGSLATQGRMGIALRYLGMVPGEASTSVAVLKDRIYRWALCVCFIQPSVQATYTTWRFCVSCGFQL